MRYNPDTMVNVADYGTSDAAFQSAVVAAKENEINNKDLYFSAGSYELNSEVVSGFGGMLFGQRKDLVTLTNTQVVNSLNTISCQGAQDLTTNNISIGSFYHTDASARQHSNKIVINNCIINCGGLSSAGYFFQAAKNVPQYGAFSVDISDNIINLGGCYQGFNLRWLGGLKFKNNRIKFNGRVDHALRIEPQWQYCTDGVNDVHDNSAIEISNNDISATDVGMVTGIMFASNRRGAISGARVFGNKLSGVEEEGIAFDGFGNNDGLCPTLCIGTLSSVSNDADGRLVIGFDNMQKSSSGVSVSSIIEERPDWLQFRFSFNRGTGFDGLIARIHSVDASANTIKLDLFINAAAVNLSGLFAVQAGFYNCEIKNNEIFGSHGVDQSYGVGISLWLNCCGFDVSNNFISGMPDGISVSGGLMLSLYETIAWHNTIRDNTIVGAYNDFPLKVQGVYGSQSYQYGNRVYNNWLSNGGIQMKKQKDFIFHNNYSKAGVVEFTK